MSDKCEKGVDKAVELIKSEDLIDKQLLKVARKMCIICGKKACKAGEAIKAEAAKLICLFLAIAIGIQSTDINMVRVRGRANNRVRTSRRKDS